MSFEPYQLALVAFANIVVIALGVKFCFRLLAQKKFITDEISDEEPVEAEETSEEFDQVYSQLHDEVTGCPTDALLIHSIHKYFKQHKKNEYQTIHQQDTDQEPNQKQKNLE